MVQFTSDPLDVAVGDIVVERASSTNNLRRPTEVYWVIYKVQQNASYGNTQTGCWAFNLEDENDVIGPIVFRNSVGWEYRIIRYG